MTETPNRSLPLIDVDQGQRTGGTRLNTALGMIDADLAAILLALASKAASADIAPAITAAIEAVIDGAPGSLDTLKEIADKLADSDDAVAALVSAIATKASQVDHDALSAALADLAAVVATKANAGNVYSRTTIDGMFTNEAAANAAALAAAKVEARRLAIRFATAL